MFTITCKMRDKTCELFQMRIVSVIGRIPSTAPTLQRHSVLFWENALERAVFHYGRLEITGKWDRMNKLDIYQ
jgi:hypothetical protein